MANMSSAGSPAGAKWAIRVLTLLILCAFVPSAVMKLVQAEPAVTGFHEMGLPDGALVPIGIVELLCVVIFLVPRTVVLGTLLLTGYLGGATLAHIVGGTLFIHTLVIGLMVWAVASLRVPELRTLLPFVRGGRV